MIKNRTDIPKKRNSKVSKITFSALCTALAIVLPFLTGHIPEIGSMLCPMHIPVFLCGFVCGWPWGLVVGFVSPLLKSVLTGYPVMFPAAAAMAFELAAYGAVSGALYAALPKKTCNIYVSLICAMIAGRIVWGIARFLLAGLSNTAFPMSAFLAGAVTTALPGIILHIILIPLVVMALRRTGLMSR